MFRGQRAFNHCYFLKFHHYSSFQLILYCIVCICCRENQTASLVTSLDSVLSVGLPQTESPMSECVKFTQREALFRWSPTRLNSLFSSRSLLISCSRLLASAHSAPPLSSCLSGVNVFTDGLLIHHLLRLRQSPPPTSIPSTVQHIIHHLCFYLSARTHTDCMLRLITKCYISICVGYANRHTHTHRHTQTQTVA